MTKLEQELCRILDFPEKYLGVAKSEAVDKSKLRNTWMFINGKLNFVHTFELALNTVVCNNKNGEPYIESVETLGAFVPESGLYSTESGVLSVTKKAAKSWVKSFRPENYQILDVNYPKRKLQNTDLIELSTTPRELITVDVMGKIWIYGCIKNEVATFLDTEEVVVTNPKYYQEVLDYVTRKGLGCSVNLQ